MDTDSRRSLLRNRDIRNVTLGGFAVNLLMSGGKLLVGYLGGSKALIADAAHSLSDAASDVGLLIGLRFWSRPNDDSHPYGHGKYENITALAISAFLALTAGGIIWDALAGGAEPTVPSALTFWMAVASIVVKELLYRWTLRVGKAARSETVIANAWHHRSDALSSVVAAGSIIISRTWEDFAYVDDIGAVVVGVILLQAAGKIAAPAFGKLTDRAASRELREAIHQAALLVPGVCTAHAMRSRYIGADVFVDMHVEVEPALTVRQGHDIATAVHDRIVIDFPEVADVVVHIEPFGNG